MLCSNCGCKVNDEANYCEKCGAKLRDDEVKEGEANGVAHQPLPKEIKVELVEKEAPKKPCEMCGNADLELVNEEGKPPLYRCPSCGFYFGNFMRKGNNIYYDTTNLRIGQYIASQLIHGKYRVSAHKNQREKGLEDEHELQSYFIQRIESFLTSKGRKLIGWDEILEGGLAENAAVMSWRGEEGGIAAANMGHYVVMTPSNWCYFDYYQSDPKGEPLAIGGLTTLEEVYEYDPMPEKIDPDKRHLILGVQANVWTEYISTTEYAEYMIFPRLCAMAEVQWCDPGDKNYDDFMKRMIPHYARLSASGINYRVQIDSQLSFISPCPSIHGAPASFSSFSN